MTSRKRWVAWFVMLSASFFLVCPVSAAFQVPSIDITISGLDTFDLAAFDLNLQYDHTALTFDSYSLSGELGSIVAPPGAPDAEDWSAGDNGLGTVNLAVFSYLSDFSAQSDTFTLASVYFVGDEAALDGITLSDILLSDDSGNPIGFTISGTHIDAVPIPGAAWMLGTGLASLAGLRKRYRWKA